MEDLNRGFSQEDIQIATDIWKDPELQNGQVFRYNPWERMIG